MLLPGSTLCVIAIAITAASGCNSAQRPDSTDIERFALSRIQMVERDIEDRGVDDPLVLSAMLTDTHPYASLGGEGVGQTRD
jgi:hypothetical protein